MKSFSKAEIDEWRGNFVDRNYPMGLSCLDGRSVGYFVLPSKLFQGIPNGLFRMTGAPSDGYLVGVSEDVPEIIKPHFAMSEHDEFMVYGLDDMDRALHSEQNMMRVIGNKELGKTYADNKIILYDHMLRESEGKLEQWGFTQKDHDGFQRAVDFLRANSSK
jgi:hypothetical protein